MSALRKVVALVAILSAALLLFVVVCPLTPTPIAVVTSPGSAPVHGLVAAIVVALPVLATVFVFAFAEFRTGSHIRPTSSSVRVIDLTCVRLC